MSSACFICLQCTSLQILNGPTQVGGALAATRRRPRRRRSKKRNRKPDGDSNSRKSTKKAGGGGGGGGRGRGRGRGRGSRGGKTQATNLIPCIAEWGLKEGEVRLN